MEFLDWAVVVVFLVSMILLGMVFSKKAGENIDSFFVSGRSLKWWVAGASMIATSFAADTPLWVGSLVRQYGIHAAWQYWAPLIGSALGVVLFAKMWRRSGVVTDNEILELRYSGKPAMALRGIASGIGAIVICPLIIGWVAKAMVTISQETLGLTADVMILGQAISPDIIVTVIVMICALLLCALSGLYGVVYTDLAQFAIATIGAFLLAWLSVKEVGGLHAMYEQLSTHPDWQGKKMNLAPEFTTKLGPDNTSGAMSIWNGIGYFAILWWGVALSGGYNAQRILASKDPSHASRGMLLHTVVYYAVVSLPWVLVGLASILVFPDMGDAGHDAAYPRMILHVLPVGLKGLMIAAMIAAFISTMSTLFNWGSSYMVNDLYRRFMRPNASDKHYVNISRALTVVVAIIGGWISFKADNIQQLLGIFFVVGCGGAVVGVARWLWWRINATGELVAFVGNWIIALVLLFGHIPLSSPAGYDLSMIQVESAEQMPEQGRGKVILGQSPEGMHLKIFTPKGRAETSKDLSEAQAAELLQLLGADSLTIDQSVARDVQDRVIMEAASLSEVALSEPIFDAMMNPILRIPEAMSFTKDHDFLGARMLFMSIWGLLAVVMGSLFSKPTETERLKEFCARTKIFLPGWSHITKQIPDYQTAHPTVRTILDWFLVMACVVCLLFSLNSLVLCKPFVTGGLFVLFVILLVVVLKRIGGEEPDVE